eukprot:gene11940-13026_t
MLRAHTQMNVPFLKIPLVLYRELFTYLQLVDQLEFVRINKDISTTFIKQIRTIHIFYEKFFYDDLYRRKLLSLIENPSHQLQVFANGNSPSFYLRRKTPATTFTTIPIELIHRLSQQQYGIEFERIYLSNPSNDNEDYMRVYAAISELQPHTKHLSLTNWDGENRHLQLFQEIESFELRYSNVNIDSNIHDILSYKHLTCLTLVYCNVLTNTNLQCLSHIYDLTLIACNTIQDITCLKNNYKITIDQCSFIDDYSNSFEYSTIIHLTIKMKPTIKMMYNNTTYLKKVKEFNLKCIHLPTIYSLNDHLPMSTSSLQSLTLCDVYSSFTLPKKSGKPLKVLSLRQVRLQSCENMENIYHIIFIGVPVPSLEGLGRGNKIVELTYCKYIQDFSYLKDCEKVKIDNCDYFNTIESIQGVPIIELLTMNSIMDLHGVTSFMIREEIYPSIMKSIELSKTIHTILIHFQLTDIKNCLLLLCHYHHINKIIINSYHNPIQSLFNDNNDNNDSNYDQEFQQLITNNFIIETVYRFENYSLLRKRK